MEKKPDQASEERKAEARLLFNQATGSEGHTLDRSRWGTLWLKQKEWKKGWAILGFTPREIDRIRLNKPDWV